MSRRNGVTSVIAVVVAACLAFLVHVGVSRLTNRSEGTEETKSFPTATTPAISSETTIVVLGPSSPARSADILPKKVVEFEKNFFGMQLEKTEEDRKSRIAPYSTEEFLSTRDFTVGDSIYEDALSSGQITIEVTVDETSVVSEINDAEGIAYFTAFVTIQTSQNGEEAKPYVLPHKTVWVKVQDDWLVISSDL